jgi:hypothetical protein
MSSDFQVWIGSIPGWFSEEQALEELSSYGIRPWKLVYRTREGGAKDLTDIHTSSKHHT